MPIFLGQLELIFNPKSMKQGIISQQGLTVSTQHTILNLLKEAFLNIKRDF
jgi:hypothetical protein